MSTADVDLQLSKSKDERFVMTSVTDFFLKWRVTKTEGEKEGREAGCKR